MDQFRHNHSFETNTYLKEFTIAIVDIRDQIKTLQTDVQCDDTLLLENKQEVTRYCENMLEEIYGVLNYINASRTDKGPKDALRIARVLGLIK